MHIELTKALETSKHVAKESTDDKTGGRSASTAFKRIDDLLNSQRVGSTALDRMELSSWILFLRYLEAREDDRRMQQWCYRIAPAWSSKSRIKG